MDLSTYFDGLMNRAPLNPGEVATFLKEMRRTPSGALVTSKLLATKIQCGSEAGAIQAFNFLEAALNSESEGSIEFRTEIGRYRFLNEIIRILSPKYLGEQTSQSVKDRAVQFLQDAAGPKRQKWFPSEHSKIVMVYNSLIETGLVEKPNSGISAEAAAEAELQKSIFDRAENAAILKKLLTSKDPADLEAANRLIKKLVDQETARNERRAELHSLLDRIDTSTNLLKEMLTQVRVDWELVDELSSTCQNLRQKLGAVPSETSEETTALLQASENIEEVLKVYQKRKTGGDSELVLVDASIGDSSMNEAAVNGLNSTIEKTERNLTDELLGSLGLLPADQINLKSPDLISKGDENLLLNFDMEVLPAKDVGKTNQIGAGDFVSDGRSQESSRASALGDIEKLSQELMQQSLQNTGIGVELSSKKTDKLTLSQLQKTSMESKLHSSPSSNQNESWTMGILKSSGSNNPIGIQDTSWLQQPIKDTTTASLFDLSYLENRNTKISENKNVRQVMDEKPLDVTKIEVVEKPLTTPSPTPDIPATAVIAIDKIAVIEDFKKLADISQIKSIDLDRIEILESVDSVELKLESHDSSHRQEVSAMVSFGRYPEFSSRVGLIILALSNRSSKDQLLNYVFQLIPPKGIHIKLLAPSCTELSPWKKSFLPPPSLTQIGMLVASESVSLTAGEISAKFILSYCLGDETYLHNGTLVLPASFF